MVPACSCKCRKWSPNVNAPGPLGTMIGAASSFAPGVGLLGKRVIEFLRLFATPKRHLVCAIHLARRSRLASGRFRRSPNSRRQMILWRPIRWHKIEPAPGCPEDVRWELLGHEKETVAAG